MFMKDNMSRDKNFSRLDIKKNVTFIVWLITQANCFYGSSLKFGSMRLKGRGMAQTTKNFESVNVR